MPLVASNSTFPFHTAPLFEVSSQTCPQQEGTIPGTGNTPSIKLLPSSPFVAIRYRSFFPTTILMTNAYKCPFIFCPSFLRPGSVFTKPVPMPLCSSVSMPLSKRRPIRVSNALPEMAFNASDRGFAAQPFAVLNLLLQTPPSPQPRKPVGADFRLTQPLATFKVLKLEVPSSSGLSFSHSGVCRQQNA